MLGIVWVLLVLSAGFFYLVPYERIEIAEDVEDLGIGGYLTIPHHLLFTPRSYEQTIDIAVACIVGTIDIVVLNSNEWGSWYTGEEYSSYYELKNASEISTTITIDPPYEGSIDIMIQTNYGDVILSASMVGHSMAYNELLAILSVSFALPFIVGWVVLTVQSKRDGEPSRMSTESEQASPE